MAVIHRGKLTLHPQKLSLVVARGTIFAIRFTIERTGSATLIEGGKTYLTSRELKHQLHNFLYFQDLPTFLFTLALTFQFPRTAQTSAFPLCAYR